jgi:hypothetical protein
LQRRTSQVGAILAAAIVLAGLAGGCSSAPAKPEVTVSTESAGAYHDKLLVALVSCFYQHHLLPASSLAGPPPLPVKDGQLQVTNRDGIINWFGSVSSSTTVDGDLLGNWLSNATNDTSWPTSLCGPKPSAAG